MQTKESGPKALILRIATLTLDFDFGKGSTVSFADAVDEMASEFFSYTQFNET